MCKKAGAITCLFLFLLIPLSNAQECSLQVDAEAYDLVLNLRNDEALKVIGKPETAGDHYVLGLAEALELLITENAALFSDYEDRYKDRLDLKLKSSANDIDFLRAETKLQWAFVYLKFGHEFDAALNLREAYAIASELKRSSPNYLPIRKTTGLLNIIIGSVPEKYNWLLSLLGMEGSVEEGIKDLKMIQQPDCFVNEEGYLLRALVQGFIFQKPDSALVEIHRLLSKEPDHRLALFLASSLSIKNFQSEQALTFLNRFKQKGKGIPIYYTDYLTAEIHLHKGEYVNAISSYETFINEYEGLNYIKDAYYKIGLCHWLNGNPDKAKEYFKFARTKGKDDTEADKAAARNLKEKELPHVELSKARYFTDGGFYKEAEAILNSVTDEDLPTQHNQTEYYYRKARLAHRMNRTDPAKLFYKQTIDIAGEENWYFAPNSCLQMGYILLDENKKPEAKKYFEKALSYKDHEYKNSIDAKAKSALAQLKKK